MVKINSSFLSLDPPLHLLRARFDCKKQSEDIYPSIQLLKVTYRNSNENFDLVSLFRRPNSRGIGEFAKVFQ